VHSCCCIGVFVLSGLFQNSKGIRNPIQNAFVGKKKKRGKPSSLTFGLLACCLGPAGTCSPAALLPLPLGPSHYAAQLHSLSPFHGWPTSSFPASRRGPSPAVGPASRARPRPLSPADVPTPPVSAISILPTPTLDSPS
jgi:hypothetical protein